MTLSAQDNAKLSQELKSGFKKIINWNKYLSKPELLAQNPNLNHLVEPRFQGINRLFVSAFENDAQRTSNIIYYVPNVEIKDCDFMTDGKNLFDQPVKIIKQHMKTLAKVLLLKGMVRVIIRLCLLQRQLQNDSNEIYLNKQQALDTDPRPI